jgi:hypothetical protein
VRPYWIEESSKVKRWLLAVGLVGLGAPEGAAVCLGLYVAEIPFEVCLAMPGFEVAGPGHFPLRALRLDNPPEYVFVTEYEAGVPVGGHTPTGDFRATFRWHGTGPKRHLLDGEFCGPEPVPVVLRSKREWGRCGQPIPLMIAKFPDESER